MAKSLAEHARQAAIARTDLNTLYGVIAILEGGTISSAHSRDVSRIIAICRTGAGKALARYDSHMAVISGAST